MQGKIDYSSGLRNIAPPRLRQIKQTVTLNKAARLRLVWMDYYHTHGTNAALTARHFGIAKSCFFKWKRRYDQHGMSGLTDQSKRPQTVRQPLTPRSTVECIRMLRKTNPEYSKYKLQVILQRDYGYQVSASTVGRVISRQKLFFTSPVKPKGHPHRLARMRRERKPKALLTTQPGQLIEFDVKHLPTVGTKHYAFVAIDVVSKRVVIHVGSTISSTQGALAWRKTIAQLGLPEAVLTDNGSENLGVFAELLQEQPTKHYFARPHTPKDKPHVERFTGTLERECIQWGGVANDVADQQDIINQWLTKYHSYRPHQALNYLTPDEYRAKLKT
jgi:transposase InsO family protein